MDLLASVLATAEVPLAGTVLRLVQQQGINSLGPLVDDLDQLARLESLVDSSKPPMPSLPVSHPLLTTPFRYPPLRHGSRFGGREHRGMFYGSRTRLGSLVGGRMTRCCAGKVSANLPRHRSGAGRACSRCCFKPTGDGNYRIWPTPPRQPYGTHGTTDPPSGCGVGCGGWESRRSSI